MPADTTYRTGATAEVRGTTTEANDLYEELDASLTRVATKVTDATWPRLITSDVTEPEVAATVDTVFDAYFVIVSPFRLALLSCRDVGGYGYRETFFVRGRIAL